MADDDVGEAVLVNVEEWVPDDEVRVIYGWNPGLPEGFPPLPSEMQSGTLEILDYEAVSDEDGIWWHHWTLRLEDYEATAYWVTYASGSVITAFEIADECHSISIEELEFTVVVGP